VGKVTTYLSFIRFSHSVFALPFALTGALLAWQPPHDAQYASWGPREAAPFAWRQIVWVVVAMVAARSAAMGFNRLVDARMDALNPRTAAREIPAGVLSRGEATLFVLVTSLVFMLAATMLNPLCGMLSPLALLIVFWYSLAKRYTSYTQLFLGLAMAVAPVGGWLAAGGPIDAPEPWLLGLAIGLWVGGFDILYACQDVVFDRAHGLNSIPVRFGVARSLWISRAMHVATIACMAVLGMLAALGPIYFGGVVLVAALLFYEQSLVSENDLSQVKRAFDLNGWVGILYFAATGISLYVR
jgi:4-hydroxybenzoate polyprenyltransferase